MEKATAAPFLLTPALSRGLPPILELESVVRVGAHLTCLRSALIPVVDMSRGAVVVRVVRDAQEAAENANLKKNTPVT